MNSIKIHKCFFAWNEEKERDWLRKKAKEGWGLKRVSLNTYIFEKGTPEDVTFAFDYRILDSEHFKEYQTLFSEFGWEYIDSVANWHYFRNTITDRVYPDIYYDKASKIKKYKRVALTLLMSILPYCFIIVFYLTMNWINPTSFFNIFLIILGGINAFIGYALFRIVKKIRKIERV